MASAEQQHMAWRKLVPYLYDWFASHSMTWPSLACRWGPVLERGAAADRQRLYLSEQTDGSEPNRLVLVDVTVAHPRVASAEQLQSFSEQGASPAVSAPVKALLHPGEVNRMREVPQHPHVVVTHTDAPQLFVWNTDAQPNRAGAQGTSAEQQSVPDLVLHGHTRDAEFALGVSDAAPLVASGGKDTQVLVWDLDAHSTSLAAGGSPGAGAGPAASTRLDPLRTLSGHAATVEDVCWCPGSGSELASVGDDYALLLWDTRLGGAPVARVAEAHGPQDVHCVAWSPHQQEMLVTGAADGTLNVWDRRRAGSPLWAFQHHSAAVTAVEWCPQRPGVFASAGEDRLLCVWDLEARGEGGGNGGGGARRPAPAVPRQMLFQHAGHRAPVVDFQWNPAQPWAFFSVADEAGQGGGGTLQLWRVSDLVYRPEDEVLRELEQYRDFIISGDESALQRKPSGAGTDPSTAAADSRGEGEADVGGGS